MADFTGDAFAPKQQGAVDDHSAANTGADRDIDKVIDMFAPLPK